LFIGLAAAVVGGMITSTFLTLVIIPVIYMLFSDLTEFFVRRQAKPAPTAESEAVVGK
jgi:HAE1 family hydrophobic/amphiphilic exporter-1